MKFEDAHSFEDGFEMSDREFTDLVAYAKDKGIEATNEEIQISKDKIQILFKSFVGRNILDEDGFYPIYHKIDTTFKRAVYELRTD
jgi:carboxyl-terminal processing protease